MQPKLSEAEHKYYLDKFLRLVKDTRQRGLEELLQRIAPCIQDNLSIARDVGYGRLTDKYIPLFQREGLDFEF